MTYQIGIQYTRFARDRSIRQAFLNVVAPINLDALSEENLVDLASRILKDIYPDDLIMIDNVNRDGPVSETCNLEA